MAKKKVAKPANLAIEDTRTEIPVPVEEEKIEEVKVEEKVEEIKEVVVSEETCDEIKEGLDKIIDTNGDIIWGPEENIPVEDLVQPAPFIEPVIAGPIEEKIYVRPTRGHQQKVFENKPVKKDGSTVRTQSTDVAIKGDRHERDPASGTIKIGSRFIRHTK